MTEQEYEDKARALIVECNRLINDDSTIQYLKKSATSLEDMSKASVSLGYIHGVLTALVSMDKAIEEVDKIKCKIEEANKNE